MLVTLFNAVSRTRSIALWRVKFQFCSADPYQVSGLGSPSKSFFFRKSLGARILAHVLRSPKRNSKYYRCESFTSLVTLARSWHDMTSPFHVIRETLVFWRLRLNNINSFVYFYSDNLWLKFRTLNNQDARNAFNMLQIDAKLLTSKATKQWKLAI